jgi:hypothetical protein
VQITLPNDGAILPGLRKLASALRLFPGLDRRRQIHRDLQLDVLADCIGYGVPALGILASLLVVGIVQS